MGKEVTQINNQALRIPISVYRDDILLGVKMISRHRPPGFVPLLEVEEVYLQADVSSYLSMEAFLERHVLTDQSLSNLIMNVVKTVRELDRYYLDEAFVSLDMGNMYYDYQKKQTMLVYGIDSYKKNSYEKNEEVNEEVSEGKVQNVSIEGKLKKFIRDLIYEKARLEMPNSEFVSKVLTYLKEPGWHIKGLTYILEEYEGEAGGLSQEGKPMVKAVSVHDKSLASRMGEPKIEEYKPSSAKGHSKKKKAKSKQTGRQAKGTNVKVLLLIGLLVCTVLILACIWLSGLSQSEKFGGGILSVSILAYIAIKIYNSDKNLGLESNPSNSGKRKVNILPKMHTKKKGNTKKAKVGMEGIDRKAIDRKEREVKRDKRNNKLQVESKFKIKEDQTDLSGDRTVVMSQVRTKYVLRSAKGQKLPLDKDVMVIGRQDGVADILIHENTSVGRQHARLIQIDSGYAVKDLKSVNGTYVNDKKVIPEQPIALVDGDVLRISNECFTFQSVG
ncbi:FHA domain-containing protein [Fusibacter sp. JL216-2]|uniref:FHA domain-containing protein n=1 Tax=Fusibacter sp. JL216-2 TaxID=3071453 RepID=UPI003D33160F